MLMLLSPAKTLDYERPVPSLPLTTPDFVKEAKALIAEGKAKAGDFPSDKETGFKAPSSDYS